MSQTRVVHQVRGAGRWFPGDKHALEAIVTASIEGAVVPAFDGRIVAGIAPHAGYAYSGSVAGHTFRALRDNAENFGSPETVIVLGISHHSIFEGIALMGGDVLQTPLGEAVLDRELADDLLSADPLCVLNDGPHDGEHSAENEIPFVQVALPESKLVVGLFGGHDAELTKRLAISLSRMAERKQIVVIASTDLLHDPDYTLVTETDRSTMDQIAGMDDHGLEARWSPGFQVCCGIRPVTTAIHFARKRACSSGTVLAYRNSGDDHPESRGDWVVGYGSAVFSLPSSS